jgi:hypothetical protein
MKPMMRKADGSRTAQPISQPRATSESRTTDSKPKFRNLAEEYIQKEKQGE